MHSEADPCAFHKKGAIVLCYVDDCLLFAQEQKDIDELITSLKEDFDCTGEGEADGCLGVETRSEDGKMTLRQPQLKKKTIEMLGLNDANPKGTPSLKPFLNKNTDGKNRNEDSFHCRLVVGS